MRREILSSNSSSSRLTLFLPSVVIQSYTLNENSAIMSCATQQVYQSLGKLIKLCDEVMLSEKSGECASLSNENVREVIDLLEDAVRVSTLGIPAQRAGVTNRFLSLSLRISLRWPRAS